MSREEITDLIATAEARQFGRGRADDIEFVQDLLGRLAASVGPDSHPADVAKLIDTLASQVVLEFWIDAGENGATSLTPAMQVFVELSGVISQLGPKWCETVGPVIANAVDLSFAGVEFEPGREEDLAIEWLAALADAGGVVGQLAAAQAMVSIDAPRWRKRSLADKWLSTFDEGPLRILASFRQLPPASPDR